MKCSNTKSIAKTISAMMMEAIKTVTAVFMSSLRVGQVVL